MSPIVPCLWFDGHAEEAARLYTEVVGGRVLQVTHWGEAGPDVGYTTGAVLSVDFELRGQRHMAINGGPQFRFTEAVSLQVMCETQDEVDRLWAGLTDGGEPGPCGWLKDRFGLSWQITPAVLPVLLADDDVARKDRVMAAMLRMGKLDIAALEAAAG